MGRLATGWFRHPEGPATYCSLPDRLCGGNRVRLLRNGERAFPAMLEAIASATRYVLVEFYRIRSDKTGWAFAKALADRARNGVMVWIVVDGFGALSASPDFWAYLRDHGVKIQVFGPLRGTLPLHSVRRLLNRLNRRTHRKVLVVDGRVGFTGGINIGDEFASKSVDGMDWRDTSVEVRGPAVFHLRDQMGRLWKRLGGVWPWPGMRETDELALDASRQRGEPVVEGLYENCLVGVVGTNRKRSYRVERRAYIKAIDAARDRVYITNAYFIPPGAIIRALRRACRRGVEVVIITAGTTDLLLVRLASHYLFDRLMSAGIQLYEWCDTVLHAKTAVVDGVWSTIGSFNLDARSILHNLELNVVVLDDRLGQAMEEAFRKDLQTCKPVDPIQWPGRSLWTRCWEWVAYQLRYWL